MPSLLISVLLVEDDQKIARLTQEYLETHGLRVRWVADGDAALRESAHTAYDVIEAHGGSITVRSKAHSGSRFVVHLPDTPDQTSWGTETTEPLARKQRRSSAALAPWSSRRKDPSRRAAPSGASRFRPMDPLRSSWHIRH